MYLKLALRNTKRSMLDYLLYMASMVMLTSIIFLSLFSFHGVRYRIYSQTEKQSKPLIYSM